MDNIHNHGLAKLLNEGFDGEAHLEGVTIQGYIESKGDEDGPNQKEFYMAEGNFRLSESTMVDGGYNLEQRDSSGRLINNFNFAKKQKTKAKDYDHERGPRGVSVEIDLAPKAFLQICTGPESKILY